MAALPKFEVATGSIDGANTAFVVSGPYQPGTVAVFLNGQLKRKDFADGWTETNPATGLITLDEPPLDADVVQVFFIDGSGAGTPDVVEVSPLVGLVVSADDLTCSFQTTQDVVAKAEAEGDLSGTMFNAEAISATLEESEQLHGILSEVCE